MASVIELEVTTKVYGSRSPGESSMIAFPDNHLRLRDIISLKVRAEMERREREQDPKNQPSLSARYLTADSLPWAKGKGMSPSKEPIVKVAAELERALQVFEDHKYFIMINHVRARELDEMIELNPQTQIQFIKVMPLRGG